jgi:site-specific recombinase XerD
LSQFSGFLADSYGRSVGAAEPISFSDHHGGLATAVATQTESDIDQLLFSVDVDAVRAYLAFLNDRQYSKATIARKLATLRSFYKFVVKTNRLSSNPVSAVRRPSRRRSCRGSWSTMR